MVRRLDARAVKLRCLSFAVDTATIRVHVATNRLYLVMMKNDNDDDYDAADVDELQKFISRTAICFCLTFHCI